MVFRILTTASFKKAFKARIAIIGLIVHVAWVFIWIEVSR